TLRYSLKNDSVWFNMLKGFYQQYQYQNIASEDFFNYVNNFTKKDFTPFFKQYFMRAEIPKVRVRVQTEGQRTRIFYKLEQAEEQLEMPIDLSLDGRIFQLDAGTTERNIEFIRVFKSIKAVNTQALVEILPIE
ncbi:MAG TPA: hypothetical protein VFX48_06315, partial [Saprospiraceae bacterium]|nr:hypothetical protein [Saprospiraceae bacterium]